MNYRRIPTLASYDGSAARVLDGAEIVRPQPQVRPRERAIARPKVQVREAGQVSLFAVVGFLAVGIFAALVLLGNLQLTRASDQVVALNTQLNQLKSDGAKLQAKYELAFDLNALETELLSSGTMMKPQSGQEFYLDLSEPDSVRYFAQEESGAAAGVLEQARQLFANLTEYFR